MQEENIPRPACKGSSKTCTPPWSQDKVGLSCCDGPRPSQAPYPRQEGLNLAPTGAALPGDGQRLHENNTWRLLGDMVALPHHLRHCTITLCTDTCAPKILSQVSQMEAGCRAFVSSPHNSLRRSEQLIPERPPCSPWPHPPASALSGWETPPARRLQQLHQLTLSHPTGVTMSVTQTGLIDGGSDGNRNMVKNQVYEEHSGGHWQGG